MSEDIALVRDASFIFTGRVRDVDSAPAADDQPAMAQVEVETVHFSPQLLMGSAGQVITIGFGTGEVPESGARRVFFTNPVEFSDHVLAYSVDHVDSTDDDGNLIAGLWDEEVRRMLTERTALSSVIVHGVVTALHQAEGEASHSEHDPDWWIARVTTRAVLKGEHQLRPDGTLEVVFANSRDVSWIDAPKLAPGQEAIIFARLEEDEWLHKVKLAVLEPGDVLGVSAERLTQIRELIG